LSKKISFGCGGSSMDKSAKIYIAGHRGLVGSAIPRHLQAKVDLEVLI